MHNFFSMGLYTRSSSGGVMNFSFMNDDMFSYHELYGNVMLWQQPAAVCVWFNNLLYGIVT